MTYCVAMSLDEGLLFASDCRTNAGVDHVSTFSKMTVVEQPGERALVLLNAGNLATTQAVISTLRKRMHMSEPSLLNVPSMFDAAQLVGDAVRTTIHHHDGQDQAASGVDFTCTFLVGGQIGGEAPRLFLVYPQGNFIETSSDTCYFQIGESKYGKPIIDRVVKPATQLDEAVKCALVSIDSTMRSNLSVGLPLDLAIVRRDALRVGFRHRIDADDPYFQSLRTGWGQGLRRVFNELPAPQWLTV
ncbi:MAG TPA: proteasome-type protease [Quisquiliibacterium sp.]|nr:proteasome-type protease [Quisquiliibacterium sp.]HQD82299.1 proteasome-type protease [Quisquiliibacterium sp.]